MNDEEIGEVQSHTGRGKEIHRQPVMAGHKVKAHKASGHEPNLDML